MRTYLILLTILILGILTACSPVEVPPTWVQETVVAQPPVMAEQVEPVMVAQVLPTRTPLPPTVEPTAESTRTPLPPTVSIEQNSGGIRPKQAVSSSDAIATWTPTPRPLPTVTPTPWVDLTTGNSMFNEWRWIDVDLSRQHLTAYENGQPVYGVSISSGRAQFPTVTGQYRIYMRYETQTLDGSTVGPEYNYYTENVPYVQYFYKGYALHGAYWHNSFGTPVSHGCVNLTPYDAAWLYNFADIGTLVNVHY